MVLGGDFNKVLNFEADKLNGNTDRYRKSSEKINDICQPTTIYYDYIQSQTSRQKNVHVAF